MSYWKEWDMSVGEMDFLNLGREINAIHSWDFDFDTWDSWLYLAFGKINRKRLSEDATVGDEIIPIEFGESPIASDVSWSSMWAKTCRRNESHTFLPPQVIGKIVLFLAK